MIRRSARAVIVLGVLALAGASCSDDPSGTTGPVSVTLEPVASGLDQPLFVTAPPGDTARVFVLEQSGRIVIVRHDSVLGTPFLDVSALISCCGERGLLGLAFHPQYATNGYFYVNYTNTAGDTRVMRYHVSANADVADAASASLVIGQAQPFPNHNGGMLAFGPDGYLYVGLGDGGSSGDPQGNGQNPNTLLGKILRLDVNAAGAPYAIPAGNPFAGQAGHRGEVWDLGLRNPWRFSFDRQTGELYIGDVGQNAHEEVDVEPAGGGGRNYGWNTVEGMFCYPSGGTNCSMTGLTLPVLDYSHSDGCSITGGYVYRGQRIPSLAGVYFYSDYCSGWIHSFRMSGGQATEHTDWPTLAPGGNISSFGEDGRGELYVVSIGNGTVHRFAPAP